MLRVRWPLGLLVLLLVAAFGLPATAVRVPAASPAAEYESRWDSQSPAISLAPGERKNLWLRLVNVGLAPWFRGGVFPTRLGTSQQRDRASAFYHSGTWLSPNRIPMREAVVLPLSRAIATFSFDVVGPSQPGTYYEYFRPVTDGLTWMNDLGIYWEIKVTGPDPGGGGRDSGFKFPWDESQRPQLSFTGGPHRWGNNETRSGLDFSSGSGSTRILAMADGVVTDVGEETCLGGPCKVIKVAHDNGYEVWYVHLSSVAPGIERNKRIRQGRWLGNEGSTGADHVHIHVELRRNGEPAPWDGLAIEGWQIHQKCDGYNPSYNRQRSGAECPEGDYGGYLSQGTVHALPKVLPYYQPQSTNAMREDDGGPPPPTPGPTPPPTPGPTPPPTPGPTPPPVRNQAPRTPTLLSPPDRSTHTSTPTLQWQDNGDPDGDSVSFRVVIGSACGNRDSGWIGGTTWRPSDLPPCEYSWLVNARDSLGLESGHTPGWSFTVVPEPPPPPDPPPSVPPLFERAGPVTFTNTDHGGVPAGSHQVQSLRMAATFTARRGDRGEMRLLTVVNRGSPNWFVVRVIDGTVRLPHWGSPSSGAGEANSGVGINDGAPHRVEVLYRQGTFAVSVDGRVVITAANSYVPSSAPFVFGGGEGVYGFWGTIEHMILERLP